MSSQRGFTLIELLIVVAIIGIIAAIAIPALLRARISANEAAAIGDIRTFISAEAAYQSSNAGFYDIPSCLSLPSGCIPSYLATSPTFLDPNTASLTAKQGYGRLFAPAAVGAPPPTASGSALVTYSYAATPVQQDQSGIRGFAGDHSARICQTPDGTDPASGAASLPAACQVI